MTEPAALVLSAAIEEGSRALLAELTRAGRLKKTNVHALRVNARRLIVQLELADAVTKAVRPRSIRRLRKLLRSFSPLRDAQVQIATLKELVPQQPLLQPLLETLGRQKRRLARGASKVLSCFKSERLALELAAVRGSLGSAAPEQAKNSVSTSVNEVLLGEVAKLYLELERRSQQANPRKMRSIHRMRIAVKNYRYAVEALGSILPGSIAERLAALKACQDGVGAIHDAHLLNKTLRVYATSDEVSHPRQLDHLAQRLAETKKKDENELVQALPAMAVGWAR